MTLSFRPYAPADLAALELQPAQAEARARIADPSYAEMLAAGEAWTGLDGARVIACAGILPQWAGYAKAWALIGRPAPRDWPRLVGKIRAVLRATPHRRVDTLVTFGFGEGCRLAHLLGFSVEGVLRRYSPDGGDCFLYARVRADG